jgi:hypothetical protein
MYICYRKRELHFGDLEECPKMAGSKQKAEK